MKKKADAGMRPAYDFSAGVKGRVRGKYAAAYAEGANVILLDADVARAFPDSASVNATLRSLLELARRAKRKAD